MSAFHHDPYLLCETSRNARHAAGRESHLCTQCNILKGRDLFFLFVLQHCDNVHEISDIHRYMFTYNK